MANERQKLTKCEKLILKLISSTGGCDYSYSEMSQHLGISRQTVYLCLNSLVEDKCIEKSYFFVGKVKRCKYNVVDFFSKMGSKNFTSQKEEVGKNFTSQKNEGVKKFTSQNKLEDSGNKGISQRRVEDLGYKKRPATKLTKSLNNDYIYNNIYKSQSNDNMIGNACQGVKSIFSKKIDKILGNNIMEGSENVGKGSIVPTFKTIVKKISREKNENAQVVNKFFDESEEQDLHSVAWSVIGAVARRIADKTKARVRNLYAYMRTAIIKAVQDFFASKVDESEVKTLMYESVRQIKHSNKKKIDTNCLARNFEQREYPEEYYDSFYKNFDKVPATSVSAPSSKIDTRYLACNFPQREYPEEYFESLYETFEDEPSIPATYVPATSTSSCAKDSVMEQVRAMRDSFSKRGKIKPAPCVDLW